MRDCFNLLHGRWEKYEHARRTRGVNVLGGGKGREIEGGSGENWQEGMDRAVELGNGRWEGIERETSNSGSVE